MQPLLTSWAYSPSTPGLPGVYEIDVGTIRTPPLYSHWNGRWWGSRMDSVRGAFSGRKKKALGPVRRWRGLADEPSNDA